jgi:hypothetical protein
MVGPFGLSFTAYKKSQLLGSLQTGNVYDYALWVFIALMFIFISIDFSRINK